MANSSRLVMGQGPQPGQTFVLDQDVLTLGRDPNNDIVINDPQISRQHARIMRQGNVMVIQDMGSTNGTFVNGMRLTDPHTLAPDSVISLGDVVTLTYYEAGIATTEPLTERPTVSLEHPSYEPPPAPVPATPSYGPPSASPPAYAAPPPPDYAAVPPLTTQADEEKKSRTGLWIGCGCLALVLACIAVGLFVWYAPASFWQTLIDLGIPVPTWPF